MKAHDRLPPGWRIFALRRRAGWTREQLARAVGIDPRALRAWEEGLREPSPQDLAAIAAALGLAPDWREWLLTGIRPLPAAVREAAEELKRKLTSPWRYRHDPVDAAARISAYWIEIGYKGGMTHEEAG